MQILSFLIFCCVSLPVFCRSHCDASDQQGSGQEAGTSAPQDSSGSTLMQFSGGVNPTTWGFTDYKDLKPSSVKLEMKDEAVDSTAM